MTPAILLAQIPEGATPTTIIGAFIFISVTLVALIGWLMRHLFLTTIPGQQAAFTAALTTVTESNEKKHAAVIGEQKAQRESHEKTLEGLMLTFRQEAAAERKQCGEQFAALQASIVGLVAAQGEERKAVIASVNEHTTAQAAVYRHDLLDRMNEAVMGRELAQMRKSQLQERADAAKDATAQLRRNKPEGTS